jgi:DNA-binding transcriptional regulator YdaS (Cro superfamily)
MTTKTPLERAIDAAGGQTALARKIGKNISQQHVAYWLRAVKGVPAEMAADIETACEKAVTKEELRPDVFGAGA